MVDFWIKKKEEPPPTPKTVVIDSLAFYEKQISGYKKPRQFGEEERKLLEEKFKQLLAAGIPVKPPEPPSERTLEMEFVQGTPQEMAEIDAMRVDIEKAVDKAVDNRVKLCRDADDAIRKLTPGKIKKRFSKPGANYRTNYGGHTHTNRYGPWYCLQCHKNECVFGMPQADINRRVW